MRLLHMLNPLDPSSSDELGYAQEMNFEGLRQALRLRPKELEVIHAAAHYKEEQIELPDFFSHRFFLSRSIRDVCNGPPIKPLPLISDIMAYAAQVDADYYLYSNIDIILQPHFYAFLATYLSRGYEAVIVNRRRVPQTRQSYDRISSYSTRWGRSHPGFDCFVISRKVLLRLMLGRICVGVPFIGVAMAYNIFAYASSWKLFENEDLSFHIGMEVYKPQLHAYYWHNRRQFFSHVRPRLWPSLSFDRLPYADRSFWVRYMKWALNPSLFLRMHARLDLRRLGM